MSTDSLPLEQRAPEAVPAPSAHASTLSTLRGLDWLNFFLADVQSGVGPFLAIYLAKNGWDEQRVGVALTVAGIAGIVAQTPAGALVDALRAKRALIAVGVACLAAAALCIAMFPSFWPVMAAQLVIGAASTVFIPAVCAISVGVVGHRVFDQRQGRNQTFNSAGNVCAAISMGLIAYALSDRAIFFFVATLALPTLWALRMISPRDIDFEGARGISGHDETTRPTRIGDIVRDRRLVIFLACSVMFHFANAAMLPLLGEMLARGHGRSSMMFMSICVITTQLVITLIAGWSGRTAAQWGRKPLLLIAFAVLPARALLYTLTHNTELLVSIQLLDGIGAGLFGVVSVLVIADLTRGTGRFNLALGAITTAIGIGASLSQVIAGSIVHRFGYNAGFLFLGAIALLALGLFYLAMPETLARGRDHIGAAHGTDSGPEPPTRVARPQ